MIFPCPNKVSCPGSDNPLTNFSSEAPDPPLYLGYSTGTSPSGGAGTGGLPPPLGSGWDNSGVTTWTESTVSPDAADNTAGNGNVDALNNQPASGDASGGVGHWPVKIYTNFPQTAVFHCPDGQVFFFTTPSGRFHAFSQARADASALAYARLEAQALSICLSNIDSKACLGTAYNQTIIANCAFPPVQFGIVSGQLPPWATLQEIDQRTIRISGNPSTSGDAGIFTFSIQAIDSINSQQTKVYTIDAMGVDNDFLLPSASNQTPYSTQLTAAGGQAPYTFALAGGALPTGLTINSDGLITGTPNEPETANFDFTASVTDSTGRVCTKVLNIFVQSGCFIANSNPLPAFDQGQPYHLQLLAEGGLAPYTFQLTGGSLPSGLTLNSAGLISGTAALINGNVDASFTVKATDSAMPPVSCSATLSIPVLDYHDFPPGKKWRIKSYTNNLFGVGGTCAGAGGCGLGGAPVWTGIFDQKNFSASFITSQRDIFGNVNANSYGVSVHLTAPAQASPAWQIGISCFANIGVSLWVGEKLGSNLGMQLDSPAGIYTLNNAAFPPPCSGPASVTIEEY